MPDDPAPELAHTTIGSGDRLVLIHGFTQSSGSFGAIADGLSVRYEVCSVDLPGHGRSVDVPADDLAATAELLGRTGRSATYLGYSLGGRVALTLAHRRPELVERLIVVGATAGIADDVERAARRVADGRLADRLDPPDGVGVDLEDFLDEWLSQPLFARLTPEQQDRPSRRVNTGSGLARSLRTTGAGTQTPTGDLLGTLSMPVLLVVGAHDEKFIALAREMADRIGENASIAIIDGASHAAPFEQPERFSFVVKEWLAKTP
jgi:2-succinyl-6-hydroxy-2,4-cyclohexadiene-1-carboxylate synthase